MLSCLVSRVTCLCCVPPASDACHAGQTGAVNKPLHWLGSNQDDLLLFHAYESFASDSSCQRSLHVVSHLAVLARSDPPRYPHRQTWQARHTDMFTSSHQTQAAPKAPCRSSCVISSCSSWQIRQYPCYIQSSTLPDHTSFPLVRPQHSRGHRQRAQQFVRSRASR